MKIKSAEFVTSAPDLRACPPARLAEFAFIGRSNVGKSSLINLLVQRKDLAKTSATPGKTRLINFFKINGDWLLIDLPGYGYAKGAQTERYEFNRAVAEYIEKRDTLAAVLVLIDSRLEPQAIDLAFLEWLAGVEVSVALVFTKVDKQSATATRASVERFLTALAGRGIAAPEYFLSSTMGGVGRGDILGFIGRRLVEVQAD